jgi:penicillin-binding protein 1A
MPSDSPTDFDFDFQVNRGQADPGRRAGDSSPPRGDGSGIGAATPDAATDLDAPDRAGEIAARPSSSPRHRRFAPDSGDGDGNGRTNRRTSGRGDGRSGNGWASKPTQKPPRSKVDTRKADRKRRRPPGPEIRSARPAEDDWLSLTDAETGGGLASFPATDHETGGVPRVPREGRKLARAAREAAAQRRAEGRRRINEDDIPFEAMLERQPQKSRAARRATPLLDAMRVAVGEGMERVRDGARRVRGGATALREGASALGTRSANGRGTATELPAEVPTRPDTGGGRDGGGPRVPRIPRIASRRPRRPKRGRIKKLRLLVVALGLGVLAIVSTFFGMMMAITRDLPQLEDKRQYEAAQNSVVYDDHGRKIGTLYSNDGRILVDSGEISPPMKDATVAIEDQRFWEHNGVDIQGLVRAGIADVIPGGSTQGASTITEQFVKNALEAQGNRTVFEKFREAAIAYQLERHWDKDKILTEYLNTIYFGEGAYGIEAAAQTYFGWDHPGCGRGDNPTCASELTLPEAAMLAGIITSPSAFSPRVNPQAAMDRRNLVLEKMKDQGYIQEAEYNDAISTALPAPSQIHRPSEDSRAPYFTSWLRQLVVDKYSPARAFAGGLQIHTSLDLAMQESVSSIAYNELAGVAPTASVVVIDNRTGEIRAMVGGPDFDRQPFNIATQGLRQPGSSFKAFTLAAALSRGYSPYDVFYSGPESFPIPGVNPNKERFIVHNFEGSYAGSRSLEQATWYSDNSVFARLGLQVGTKNIARTARDMGIMDPVSKNPAMTLGGLSHCCSPLDMAYAYSTLAHDGQRVSGNLDTVPGDISNKDPRAGGPVPITEIDGPDGHRIASNKTQTAQVLSPSVASTERSMLAGVISEGTAINAQGSCPDSYGTPWGKTGTTENYGDAWFIGTCGPFTAAIWVGHPDSIASMKWDYGGTPVEGGTYPAIIWAQIMQAITSIQDSYGHGHGSNPSSGSTGSTYSAPSSSGSSTASAPSTSGGGGGSSRSSSPAPAPAPAPPPSGGGGGDVPASSGGGVGL